MKLKVKYYTPIINFPDLQTRICRNDPKIKWSGKVHERLTGWSSTTTLPYYEEKEEWALMHIKYIAKQEKQNSFYSTI